MWPACKFAVNSGNSQNFSILNGYQMSSTVTITYSVTAAATQGNLTISARAWPPI